MPRDKSGTTGSFQLDFWKMLNEQRLSPERLDMLHRVLHEQIVALESAELLRLRAPEQIDVVTISPKGTLALLTSGRDKPLRVWITEPFGYRFQQIGKDYHEAGNFHFPKPDHELAFIGITEIVEAVWGDWVVQIKDIDDLKVSFDGLICWDPGNGLRKMLVFGESGLEKGHFVVREFTGHKESGQFFTEQNQARHFHDINQIYFYELCGDHPVLFVEKDSGYGQVYWGDYVSPNNIRPEIGGIAYNKDENELLFVANTERRQSVLCSSKCGSRHIDEIDNETIFAATARDGQIFVAYHSKAARSRKEGKMISRVCWDSSKSGEPFDSGIARVDHLFLMKNMQTLVITGCPMGDWIGLIVARTLNIDGQQTGLDVSTPWGHTICLPDNLVIKSTGQKMFHVRNANDLSPTEMDPELAHGLEPVDLTVLDNGSVIGLVHFNSGKTHTISLLQYLPPRSER